MEMELMFTSTMEEKILSIYKTLDWSSDFEFHCRTVVALPMLVYRGNMTHLPCAHNRMGPPEAGTQHSSGEKDYCLCSAVSDFRGPPSKMVISVD